MTTVHQPVVVEWGDWTGGAGFVYHRGTRFDTPPGEFVQAVRDLLEFPAVQPPSDWKSAADDPVWGLVHTPVAGYGSRWCFVVQGRRHEFPNAGGCQFVFFDAETDAAQAWDLGSSAVTDRGLITPASLVGPARSWPADRHMVEAVLDGVLADRDVVAVGGGGFGIAAAIGRTLSVIPEEVARQRIWFTHLLQRPFGNRRVVAGLWPSALAATAAGRVVDDWLSAGSATGAELHPRHDEVVTWLAEQSDPHGDGIGSLRIAGSVSEFVDEIASDVLPINDADIENLLAKRDPVLSKPKARRALIRWAHDNVGRAMVAAGDRDMPDAVVDSLFDALLDVHEKAIAGSNPVCFPPDSEPVPGWHRLLARHLGGQYRDRDAMLTFACEQLTAPGRPLESEEDRVRAGNWLADIGLRVADFGVPVGLVAESIRRTGTVDDELMAAIEAAPDRLAVVTQVVARFGSPIDVSSAAELLRLAPNSEYDVTESILSRNTQLGWRLTTVWAEELVEQVPVSDGVAYALWVCLRNAGLIVPDTLLAQSLRMTASQDTTDQYDRLLMLDTAKVIERLIEELAEARYSLKAAATKKKQAKPTEPKPVTAFGAPDHPQAVPADIRSAIQQPPWNGDDEPKPLRSRPIQNQDSESGDTGARPWLAPFRGGTRQLISGAVFVALLVLLVVLFMFMRLG